MKDLEKIGNKRQEWLKVYQETQPVLQKRSFPATHQVKLESDLNSYQGWRMTNLGKINQPLILNAEDECILDFSQHLVGFLHLEYSGTGKIVLEPAEVPAELGDHWAEFTARFGNGIEPERRWFGEEIKLTGDNFHHPKRMALRYLRLRSVSGSVKLTKINLEAQSTGSFDLVAPLPGWTNLATNLDKISQITLRNCLQEVIEDGPKRDRRLWLGDLRLEARLGYLVFDCADLVKRCLFLHAAMLREDGLIAPCVYTNGKKTNIGPEFIPDYAMLFGPTLLDYCQATGDWDVGETLFGVASQQPQLIINRYADKNDLITLPNDLWCFIDWKKELDRQAAEQATTIYSLGELIKLAKHLKSDKTKELKKLKYKLIDGTVTLWDPNLKLFVSGKDRQISYASQIWMVIAGVASGDAARELLDRLAHHPQAVGIGCPYLMHHYVEALCIAGDFAKAAKILRTYWGGMVERGCDTFWEVFSPEDDRLSPYNSHLFNSYCHAWSCTPSWFLRHEQFGPEICKYL